MPDQPLLPHFRYHPDPIRSGAIAASPVTCKSCGQARGYIYTGPVYTERDGLDDSICPWCIADGSAAVKFDAYFVDVNAVAGLVPQDVQQELERRTPGYLSLQEGEWRACCGDAAAYIKPATEKDLASAEFPKSRSALLRYLITEQDMESEDAKEFIETLKPDAGHSAYLFKCLKCGKFHFHIEQE